jgi:4-amino-4-deoxy-L-arabinose transferase-like glycosyltransferase
MTLTAGRDDVGAADRGVEAVRQRWHVWALAGVCALAATLYAWRIRSEGWGNPYYAAAVKSMSQSLTNFVFGSFDPVGVVTVDKPPLAFWAMVLSAAIFGFHGWSVLLPQVVEGVAAVFLLHRAVTRWAGPNAALIAALTLALMPVTVAIDRDSNPDTMMVLLLVAAAYAMTRCIERDSTGWLMLAAALLGLGFLVKMLQAWIVVPAFVLAYLAGSAVPWGRRVLRTFVAGLVLLASSMWWVVMVGVWPEPKPYIGGSTDGTVLNLVIGYNGLGRVLGHGGRRGSGPGGGMGGQPGLLRMFDQQAGGQISWLLPLSLLVLVVAAVIGVRSARGTADRVRRAGWLLWGGWLIVVAAVLSFMQNMFHPYYTSELAPAIAAVTGAGLPLLWRLYRRPAGYGWLLLPAAVLITAAWAWTLISRDLSWNGWLRYAVAAVAVLAVLALLLDRPAARENVPGTSVFRPAGALVLLAVLLAPGVWSAADAATGGGFTAMPAAGPPGGAFGGGAAMQRNADPAVRATQGQFARGQAPRQFRGMAQVSLSAQQRRVLDYAVAHSGDARIKLAVEGGAMAAEPYLLDSNATVIGMGGFSGGDPAPAVDRLAAWVDQGRLRFVLIGGRGFGRAFGRSAATAQRDQWIGRHCTLVGPEAYGGAGRRPTTSGAQTLYECGV